MLTLYCARRAGGRVLARAALPPGPRPTRGLPPPPPPLWLPAGGRGLASNAGIFCLQTARIAASRVTHSQYTAQENTGQVNPSFTDAFIEEEGFMQGGHRGKYE